MASFFVRAASGQYDLDQPDQLMRLLVVMTRHKLAKQERRHRADRRDYRRVEGGDPAYLQEPTAANPSPSRIVASRELLEEFRRRLSEEERQLADLRGQGYEWAEIAAELGGTARRVASNWPARSIGSSSSSRRASPAMTEPARPGREFDADVVVRKTAGLLRGTGPAGVIAFRVRSTLAVDRVRADVEETDS